MDLDSFKYQFRNVMKDIPKICLLGIRGYMNPERSAVDSIYDDAIVRCIGDEIKLFTASVDPGRFYIDHPMNPQGCAKLKTGLWHYQLGEHHSKRALVQADEVTVYRLNKHGKVVGEENGYFGINVHSGGPEYLVGRYSAGCQVIKATEPWQREWLDFFTPISAAVEIYNQTKIPYLLVDNLDAIPVSETELAS